MNPTEAIPPAARIEDTILDLVAARGSGKSICPSEVARALQPGPQQDGWQSLMTPVRQAAIRLARAGRIDILRKGKPVPPEEVRGVIRLRSKGDPA
jgi:hypothetical protein